MLAILRRSIKQVAGPHLRGSALPTAYTAFELRGNVAAVASHWRHCVLFDRPGNRNLDLLGRIGV